jgi:hypothetical protein
MVLRLGNFKMPVIAMETAKTLNLTTCHTTFLLSFIQFRALSILHVFCGNGGHSEISKLYNKRILNPNNVFITQN